MTLYDSAKHLSRLAVLLFGVALATSCGGAPPGGGMPPNPVAMKRTYSLGATSQTAWAGGSGTGVPDPMQVTQSVCTHGFVASSVRFKAPEDQTAGTMNLGCVQLLTTSLSTNVSLSTTIGYGTMPPVMVSDCASGTAVVGLRFGTGTGYWLRAVAPICAPLDTWSDTSKTATTTDGLTLGSALPTSVVQCPQGSLLSGVDGIIGKLDYALDPPLRASCTEVHVELSPL